MLCAMLILRILRGQPSWRSFKTSAYNLLWSLWLPVTASVRGAGDIPQGIDHVVSLYARLNAQYILQSCNSRGCADSAVVSVNGNLPVALVI